MFESCLLQQPCLPCYPGTKHVLELQPRRTLLNNSFAGQRTQAASGPPPNAASTSPAPATNSTTAPSNISKLTSIEQKVKEDLHEFEQHHGKATVAAAATIGTLLLFGMLSCAVYLVYRRFLNARHAGTKKKKPWDDPARKYYEADKVFGDSPGM
jgi:hypothetical protein